MRKYVAAGTAIVALVALIVVVGTIDPDEPEPTASPTPNEFPRQVLVLKRDGRLLIVRSSDGRVVRTLRENFGQPATRPPVELSTDGRFAYLDEPAPTAECEEARSITRIDLRTGKTRSVARGRHPAVSNDGDQIAYVTGADCRFNVLVVQDLADGYERRWSAGDYGITYLRWSLDDSRLAFTLLDDHGFSNRTIDTTLPGGSLDRARELEMPFDDQPVGFLAGDRVLGMSVTDGEPVRLYALDRDGDEFPLTGRDRFIDVGTFDIDRSGQHVLWLERYVRGRTGNEPGDIVRFTTASRETKTVINEAIAAIWIEERAEGSV